MADEHAHPEVLVDTAWVAEHLDDPTVTIVEVNTDPDDGYNAGHVPGSILWSLHVDLEDQVRRDVPGVAQFENLMSRSGIDNVTTVVLYGDGNNRSATWAFWILKIYRHKDVRLIDGGRTKWIAEARPTSADAPSPEPSSYRAGVADWSLRATKDYILANLANPTTTLLDTRTVEEYKGEMTSAPGAPPADIYRKGRIPGAVNVDWEDGASADGSFLPPGRLQQMYSDKGLESSQEVVPYCRLGVRASYSWFVLKYLLGFPRVRNYNGSWTEWGNSAGVPVETDAAQQGQST